MNKDELINILQNMTMNEIIDLRIKYEDLNGEIRLMVFEED